MNDDKFYIEQFEFFDSPFVGTHDEMEETFKIISSCIEEIQNSNNLRHVVLETWLIIDYFIRNQLGQLLEFRNINTDEFDLRNRLLPISFDICLDLFKDILYQQRSLPSDPSRYAITLPAKFWRHMKHENENLYTEFFSIIDSYYDKYHPEIKLHEEQELSRTSLTSIVVPAGGSKKQKYCHNKQWVDSLEMINEEWIKKARWINKARNLAAHSHDSEKILKAMGFNGAEAFKHAKNECLTLVERLLGIKKIDES